MEGKGKWQPDYSEHQKAILKNCTVCYFARTIALLSTELPRFWQKIYFMQNLYTFIFRGLNIEFFCKKNKTQADLQFVKIFGD